VVEDIVAKLAKWTRKPITHKAETYEHSFDKCLTELSGEREPGVSSSFLRTMIHLGISLWFLIAYPMENC